MLYLAMSLFEEEENYFGLDLGASSIKLVQLKNLHGKPSLVTYGDIQTPLGLMSSDSPVDQDRVSDIVRKLADDARVSTKNVVAALPSVSSYVAIINTPKLSHDELASSIRFQADKYIPMAIDQVKLDWSVVGPGRNENELEVLLVAAPNSIANKYLNIIQKAGLELLALEINPIAQSRSLTTNKDLSVMIVDIGSVATDMAIISHQVPKLVRTVNVGSRALIRVVSQNLGLDEAQGEQFMRKFGLTQTKLEGQVYKSLKPVLDTVVEEINKSISYFHEHSGGDKIEKIIITGGTSALPEFPVYLANSTGTTVEIGNPWVNVSYPAALQPKLATISLNYASAIGLAMRNFV